MAVPGTRPPVTMTCHRSRCGQNPGESFSLNLVTMAFKYQVAGSPIQTVNYNLATGT
jgi:hypothetical protein